MIMWSHEGKLIYEMRCVITVIMAPTDPFRQMYLNVLAALELTQEHIFDIQ